jgi:hypothetical protein
MRASRSLRLSGVCMWRQSLGSPRLHQKIFLQCFSVIQGLFMSTKPGTLRSKFTSLTSDSSCHRLKEGPASPQRKEPAIGTHYCPPLSREIWVTPDPNWKKVGGAKVLMVHQHHCKSSESSWHSLDLLVLLLLVIGFELKDSHFLGRLSGSQPFLFCLFWRPSLISCLDFAWTTILVPLCPFFFHSKSVSQTLLL